MKKFAEIFTEWEKSNKIVDKDKSFFPQQNLKTKKEKDLSIDLHGFTKKEALERLRIFILQNRSGMKTKINIIHGVGRHSEDGKRVLKEAVKEWLSQNKELIGYFKPADVKEGGGGATIAYINPKK